MSYDENESQLPDSVKNVHRAIVSLREEFEAIDFYNQRISACTDEALKKILIHNRDEEKEHAVMLLEWLRRHDDELDDQIKKCLFVDNIPAHD